METTIIIGRGVKITAVINNSDWPVEVIEYDETEVVPETPLLVQPPFPMDESETLQLARTATPSAESVDTPPYNPADSDYDSEGHWIPSGQKEQLYHDMVRRGVEPAEAYAAACSGRFIFEETRQ